MERIIAGVVAEIVKHTVVPLLRPIGRPCKPCWAYEDNFEKLNRIWEQLRQKKEELQTSIGDGLQPPEDVSNWQGEVNTICHYISSLGSERESMRGCCAYFNVMKCYKHRRRVAQKLKEANRLELRLMNSGDLWKYKIQIQNLKKKVDDLTAEERRVLAEIEDGKRPISNVAIWLHRVITIDTGLINQQPPETPDYSVLWNIVARKVCEVERLLQEANEFEVFSEETEETKYKKDLSRLKEQVQMLELKAKDVQLRIKPGEEPLIFVQKWLGDVKKVVDEVSVLPGEHSLEEPNKVTTLLEEACRLLELEMQFTVVSRQIPPGSINYLFTVQANFQARLSLLESIIEKLKEDDVHMLGIYGMGGIGKTTLAKHVGVKVISDNIFAKVIFAEVSQTPNIKTIQTTVADALDLRFEGESESRRATKLHELLKKVSTDGREILVILDNLWEEINLDDIGIPKNCKGVKLLLTARSRQLLSNKMES